MTRPGDRGSILVLVLGVITALGVTTSALLQASSAVLRRERSVWSAVVTQSDVASVALLVVDGLRRQPTATCLTVTSWPVPSLNEGSAVNVACRGGPPQPWAITVSATHGRRSSTLAWVVHLDAQNRPVVQARSLLTGPNPALTNAA